MADLYPNRRRFAVHSAIFTSLAAMHNSHEERTQRAQWNESCNVTRAGNGAVTRRRECNALRRAAASCNRQRAGSSAVTMRSLCRASPSGMAVPRRALPPGLAIERAMVGEPARRAVAKLSIHCRDRPLRVCPAVSRCQHTIHRRESTLTGVTGQRKTAPSVRSYLEWKNFRETTLILRSPDSSEIRKGIQEKTENTTKKGGRVGRRTVLKCCLFSPMGAFQLNCKLKRIFYSSGSGAECRVVLRDARTPKSRFTGGHLDRNLPRRRAEKTFLRQLQREGSSEIAGDDGYILKVSIPPKLCRDISGVKGDCRGVKGGRPADVVKHGKTGKRTWHRDASENRKNPTDVGKLFRNFSAQRELIPRSVLF
ncbi:hypothetical protein DBV15_10648 [Temnothorax longispinosus]|uniref:Uncharacterized protein n=1 Tax=Temnothorax longispinosus TaxID=300112 RepID=A0A4S2JNH0_9HYME|nr:hypothetical protein DBV15_10648 [Temnothorax longispinosus]